MYDEAYSLAFAQQLKNKDIPEGGSKAVCLVRPGPYSKEDPKYLVRKSVKAFGDALLDLHSTHEETKSRIVDWYVVFERGVRARSARISLTHVVSSSYLSLSLKYITQITLVSLIYLALENQPLSVYGVA